MRVIASARLGLILSSLNTCRSFARGAAQTTTRRRTRSPNRKPRPTRKKQTLLPGPGPGPGLARLRAKTPRQRAKARRRTRTRRRARPMRRATTRSGTRTRTTTTRSAPSLSRPSFCFSISQFFCSSGPGLGLIFDRHVSMFLCVSVSLFLCSARSFRFVLATRFRFGCARLGFSQCFLPPGSHARVLTTHPTRTLTLTLLFSRVRCFRSPRVMA